MRKWIVLGITIFLFVLVGSTIYAYQTIRSPLNVAYEKVREYSRDVGIVEMMSNDYYFGTESFYVVQGLDESEEEVILWINDDFTFHHMEKKADGISFDDALTIVKNDERLKEVMSIKLGYERGLPIYEVTFKSEDGRKGYYYVTFVDGEFL